MAFENSLSPFYEKKCLLKSFDENFYTFIENRLREKTKGIKLSVNRTNSKDILMIIKC